MTETIDAHRQSILQNKIENLLNRRQSSVQQIMDKIQYDNEHLEDYILPLNSGDHLSFEANGSLKMNFNNELYDIHPNALSQIGDKMGVPSKYLKELSQTEWGRNLAKDILTEHKENIQRSRVLVRTVKNQARAVLSDRYRRLNSDQIYNSFIQATAQCGAVMYDACYSPTKTYLESIIPTVIPIETENNGVLYSAFGARIRNSDYGNGSLELRIFQLNVVCDNGLVGESAFRQTHLGKELPSDIQFSEKTYKLDTKTSASKIKDIVGSCLSVESIKKTAGKLQEASTQEIDVKKEITKLQKVGFLKSETAMIETEMLNSNAEHGVVGKPTKLKLSQAMTAIVKNTEEISEIRKREIAELAGGFLKL